MIAFLIPLFFLSLQRTESVSVAEDILKSYRISHDVGSGWVERGTINIAQNLTASYEPSLNCIDDEDGGLETLEFYKIRAEEMGGKSSSSQPVRTAMTSVPFCSVLRANFREEISLSLGSYDGELLSVSYTPLLSPLSPKSCDGMTRSVKDFVTRVLHETAKPGMQIPVILPEQRLVQNGLTILKGTKGKEKGKDFGLQNDRGSQTENQSFLRKYWYIILPIFLMSVFGGAPEEPAQVQGSQQVAPSQRRGKRN